MKLLTGCGSGGGPDQASRSESLLADVLTAEIDDASRATSPKAHRTFGDVRLVESQASRCAIRIDAAAKTMAA